MTQTIEELDTDENALRTQGRTVLDFWVTSLKKEISVGLWSFQDCLSP